MITGYWVGGGEKRWSDNLVGKAMGILGIRVRVVKILVPRGMGKEEL